jgi:hypothetical protein
MRLFFCRTASSKPSMQVSATEWRMAKPSIHGSASESLSAKCRVWSATLVAADGADSRDTIGSSRERRGR